MFLLPVAVSRLPLGSLARSMDGLFSSVCAFFFFNDTATTEIYTLSLHDALPISDECDADQLSDLRRLLERQIGEHRSEEHTSELQSRSDLVCRLLLAKKKTTARRSRHQLRTHKTGSHNKRLGRN